MKTNEIINARPGTRFLLSCEPQDCESLVETIIKEIAPVIKRKTLLNSSAIATMDMLSDERPNSFSDLHGLVAKLILSAGRRSHFEGLFLLNITGLVDVTQNAPRLKALGELLAVSNGLASRCITVMYGPADDRELIDCSALLDFDGKLRVGAFEGTTGNRDLRWLLSEIGARCETPEAERLLGDALNRAAGNKSFLPGKMIRALDDGTGVIRTQSIRQMLDDSYSYLNRTIRATAVTEDREKRIGFR